MKRQLSIAYTPRAVVVFYAYEVALLMTCSKNHYDGTCKDASSPSLSHRGGMPGFLCGMRNCMRNTALGARYDHTLAFRELDTLAKILEQAHLYPRWQNRRDLSRISKLNRYVRDAMMAINAAAVPNLKINLSY